MIVKMNCLEKHAALAGGIISKRATGRLDDAAMISLLAPIEQAAPRLRAESPRGALFQLLLAAGDLGELAQTENRDQAALTARLERIEACVISALSVVEQICEIDRDELGGAYFAPRDYVPEAWRKSAA